MTLDFCREYGCRYIVSMRTEEYLALVKYSCGLIGNSSSGLIEVPSLKVPTINIGDRQKGRVRGYSVIDAICKKDNIKLAILSSRKECFINRLQDETNPYYNKNVNENIMKIIKDFLNIDPDNLGYKDFYDIYI